MYNREREWNYDEISIVKALLKKITTEGCEYILSVHIDFKYLSKCYKYLKEMSWVMSFI